MKHVIGARYLVMEIGWQVEGGLDDPVLAQWPGAAAGGDTQRHPPPACVIIFQLNVSKLFSFLDLDAGLVCEASLVLLTDV